MALHLSACLLSAKSGHRPLSLPGLWGLAFASSNLQASTLSSPTCLLGARDSLTPVKVQSRHGHLPAPGPIYVSSSTDWWGHCHPCGSPSSPSQGDDSIYSLVRDKTLSPYHQQHQRPLVLPHESRRPRVGKPQENHWLMLECRALLSGLSRKTEADPLPGGSKHCWALSHPRASRPLPLAPPSLQDSLRALLHAVDLSLFLKTPLPQGFLYLSSSLFFFLQNVLFISGT